MDWVHRYDHFEDRHYYWQTYEIVRRVLQTGAVVIIENILGEEMAISYALLIAVLALSVHLYVKPYTEDDEDKLMIVILGNQAFCQFVLATLQMNDRHASMFGYLLIILQVGVIFACVKLAIPLLADIKEKVGERLPKHAWVSRYTINSKRLSDFAGWKIWQRETRVETLEEEMVAEKVERVHGEEEHVGPQHSEEHAHENIVQTREESQTL